MSINNNNNVESWGRFPKAEEQVLFEPRTEKEVTSEVIHSNKKILPRGLGRSYGDSCLNNHEELLLTTALNKFQSFDPASGILKCESGVTLEDIILTFLPKGWFISVTPGTKFVTIGGAIANDIHGKNHHKSGNFGHHVLRFELLRSNGERRICSRHENKEWFYATLGGLGLTGIILWAEIQLMPITSAFINTETIRFDSIDEFNVINKESNEYSYTVAWIDSITDIRGRGIFIRGNHVLQGEYQNNYELHSNSGFKNIVFDFPEFALSTISVKTFNALYYNQQQLKRKKFVQHYDAFFYPLDSVLSWNKIYGKRGFLQWQCVVPTSEGSEVIKSLFKIIVDSGLASFLAVLKEFGKIKSEGLMSFPMEGLTLALDFPNLGEPLYRMLNQLDQIVVESGGRIYAAKDARMSPETFLKSYPGLNQFENYIDPKFSSSFYRRVKQ